MRDSPVKVRIGTRKSKLALWQANHVGTLLERRGMTIEIAPIETKGDKLLHTTISKIGSKGVFTEELEALLTSGAIDIAVHSAKDLQSSLAHSLGIIAFTAREKSHDVLVSDQEIDLQDPNLIVGTSSTRRVAMFRRLYPNIQLVDMRGNLQTRIEKMRKGDCHALALAYAGVHRMGYGHLIKKNLETPDYLPAVGQGCLAIEAHNSLDPLLRDQIREALNDMETERCLLTERAFLREMDGGCSIPVFGLAATNADHTVTIRGGIVSLDGNRFILDEQTGNSPVELGTKLANAVLAQGGEEILEEIKNKL